MVYDRLATGKPLMVTRPVNLAAEIDTSGYLSDCEWLYTEQSGATQLGSTPTTGITHALDALDALAADGPAQARLHSWVTRYFGDTTPGSATARFHAAIAQLLGAWDRSAALHAGDDAISASADRSTDEGDEAAQR